MALGEVSGTSPLSTALIFHFGLLRQYASQSVVHRDAYILGVFCPPRRCGDHVRCGRPSLPRVRPMSITVHSLRTPRNSSGSFGVSMLLAFTFSACGSTAISEATPVASIAVSPSSVSLLTGESRSVTAVAKDAAGTELRSQRLVWSIKDKAIANVSSSGIVSGVANGNTQLSVSAAGVSAVIPVAVARRPTSVVSVTPASATIRVGATVALAATAFDNAGGAVKGRPISWKTNDVSIATVSQSGVVSGVGAGIATVTATIDGVSDAAVIGVQSLPVAQVRLSPGRATIQLRETVQLTAQVLDAAGEPLQGRTITWLSSNTGVASVSSAGVVTGTGLGSATISATSEGKSATAKVTVSLFGLGNISSR